MRTADLQSICAEQDLYTGRTAPDWVQLLPPGRIMGRDGRRFVLSDAAAVVAASIQTGVDLPIDYEHQADDPSRQKNGPVPAAGWIKSLQARPDGIWGRVIWTDKAAGMIQDGEYRYLSPVLMHRPDGTVVQLRGASLVHRPNLELKALASQETPMTATPDASALGAIAAVLDLDATHADLDQILSAIRALQRPDLSASLSQAIPDPARYLPIEAVQELLSERNTSALTLSHDRADAKVTKAMNDGYITPAMRDWAVSLCAQDPASFDAFLEKSVPPYAHLTRPGPRGNLLSGAAPRGADSVEMQAICDQLDIDPAKLAR